jgi:formate C-acetyltransferase
MEWSMAANVGMFGYGGGGSLLQLLQYVIFGNEMPGTGPGPAQRGMRPCKKLYEYETFEELQTELEAQIKNSLASSSRQAILAAAVLEAEWPCLSASVMMEGCLESGKDVTWGGAKYNGHGVMFNGIATVGDSLYAIKKLCFDDKTVSLRELYDAVKADWEGHELLRQKILNEVTFYGNDNKDADDMVAWITGLYADYQNALAAPHNGQMNSGILDLNWRMGGVRTWATPDGRKMGEPLSPSADPRAVNVKNGPLAYVKSVAKLPWYKMRCGGAINLRLDASSVRSEESTSKVRDLIESYFAQGGIQFHFTVADTAVMRAAQKEPEKYQDLIVRIAGFSAYFTHLPFDDQNNYIERYEISV